MGIHLNKVSQRTNYFEEVAFLDFFQTLDAFMKERVDIPWVNEKEASIYDMGIFISEFQQQGNFGGATKPAFWCFLVGVYVSQSIFSKHPFVESLMLWNTKTDIMPGFLFDEQEWYFDEENLLKLSRKPQGAVGRSQKELQDLYQSVHEFNSLLAPLKPAWANHSCETRAQDMGESLGGWYDNYFQHQTKSGVKPLCEFLAFFEKRFISQAIVHQEGVVSTFGRKM